jgi:hypothetical protein
VQIARSRGADLYGVKIVHGRFGEMNGQELLHVLAGHAGRHAAQIREIREMDGTAPTVSALP